MGGKNYNGKPYEPRKILLQYGKLIVNLEATYLLKNPVTVIGDEKIIVDFKKVYKKGKYDKVDFDILIHIVKYGNVYEYVYVNKKGQFTMMNQKWLPETSMKILYQLADMKAGINQKFMREGLRERFEKIATLLERMGKSYEEDDIDSLDIVFHYASPVNESDVIDNLIKLHGRSVISDKSIIDITPYITDTYVELERIKQQATARKVVEQPNVSNEGADKEHVTDKSEEVTK